MFEFVYAKRIKKEDVMEIIDKYKDYQPIIAYKPNGTLEIFISGKSKEREENHDKQRNCKAMMLR